MRVYLFSEGHDPCVTTLNDVVHNYRELGVEEASITTMVFDLDHTGFASGATRNGRYTILNADAVDKVKALSPEKPKGRPFLSLVAGTPA